MSHRSLTFRLTLFFSLASTAVLLGLGYLVTNSAKRHFLEQDMELLTGKMELIQEVLQSANGQEDVKGLSRRLNESLIGHPGLGVAVIAPDGSLLFESQGAKFPARLLDSPNLDRPVEWETGELRYRGIFRRVDSGGAGLLPIVGVATDLVHQEYFLSAFRVTLWFFITIAAGLTGVLGWLVTQRVLSPLHAIRHVAANITASRLNYRLSLDSVPSELNELVETLNDMLARLEESFRRLSDFSSDLAHELRTPISNLMTQTQVALSRSRSSSEYQDILSSNAEEFERLARTVSDMLFLAKADNGLITTNTETVDLQEEIQSLLDFYGALAEASSVALVAEGDAHLIADRLMLRRALSNLLSNAIRHADADTQVRVLVLPTDHEVKIEIENTGTIIPAEHLPRIFDRFHRVDASRHQSGEGAGLGLAITQSIIRAHGGMISVVSQNGVTRFILVIPVARPATDRIHPSMS